MSPRCQRRWIPAVSVALGVPKVPAHLYHGCISGTECPQGASMAVSWPYQWHRVSPRCQHICTMAVSVALSVPKVPAHLYPGHINGTECPQGASTSAPRPYRWPWVSPRCQHICIMAVSMAPSVPKVPAHLYHGRVNGTKCPQGASMAVSQPYR